ncbi:MAG: DUF4911 domain-containing protein [Sporomusaceae bacterium]|nr:DUF4911 domain-containing protein [Sporomusaceae bacterium]
MKNAAAVFLTVAPADISFVCKIFEGFEHLGVVTTIDRERGLLAVRATPDTRPEVLAIIASLPRPCRLAEAE